VPGQVGEAGGGSEVFFLREYVDVGFAGLSEPKRELLAAARAVVLGPSKKAAASEAEARTLAGDARIPPIPSGPRDSPIVYKFISTQKKVSKSMSQGTTVW
jgi:hypothetical protein